MRRHLLIAAFALALAGCPGQVAGTGGGPMPDPECGNRVTYQEGADGFGRVGVFHYDSAGQITSYVETTTDGAPTFSLARTYDEKGRRVQQVEEVQGLGPVHRVATWEYDDLDRVVRVSFDLDGDLTVSAYEFDGDGRISQLTTTGSSPDLVRYTYEDGDPFVVAEAHDTDGDGEANWTWRYAFAGGRWLVSLATVGSDGQTVENTETYTYTGEGEGHLLRRDFDTNADGVSDDVSLYTWDAGGHLTHTEYDSDGDGAIDQSDDYTYDDDGRMIERTWHTSASPGSPTVITSFDWGSDGVDRVERRDAATQGVIESWSLSRDCPGDLPMTLLLSPESDWAREMDPLDLSIDYAEFWGFPEVIRAFTRSCTPGAASGGPPRASTPVRIASTGPRIASTDRPWLQRSACSFNGPAHRLKTKARAFNGPLGR